MKEIYLQFVTKKFQVVKVICRRKKSVSGHHKSFADEKINLEAKLVQVTKYDNFQTFLYTRRLM